VRASQGARARSRVDRRGQSRDIRASTMTTGKLSRLQSAAADDIGRSVLVVDDSRSIRELLGAYIDAIGGFAVEEAATLAQTRDLIGTTPARFFCAALDLTLPDAPNGEVVDLVRAQGIPVVVLTGSMDPSNRQTVLAKGVVDYVVKGHAGEIEQVAYIIGRLRENRVRKVIVVDDSRAFRSYLVELLERYCYRTLQAEHGSEALNVLAEHPDTTLVITDVNMPVMGGFELISAIRRQYRREDLAIIGLSDASKAGLSAALLKAGANDFVAKPFQVEEFYCRVTQNTNMVGYVRQIKDFATRDFLTGAYNRRHLFEMGGKLYASAQRGNIAIATGVIDADHFKHINDTYGHHAGDAALKCIADVLQSSLRQTDVVAR
jgi:PleD family two-component response regulator